MESNSNGVCATVPNGYRLIKIEPDVLPSPLTEGRFDPGLGSRGAATGSVIQEPYEVGTPGTFRTLPPEVENSGTGSAFTATSLFDAATLLQQALAEQSLRLVQALDIVPEALPPTAGLAEADETEADQTEAVEVRRRGGLPDEVAVSRETSDVETTQAGIPTGEQADFHVDVAEDESAVLLIMQNGLYQWTLPTPLRTMAETGLEALPSQEDTIAPPIRREGETTSPDRTHRLVFRLPLDDRPVRPSADAGAADDFTTRRMSVPEFILDPLRVFVFKFIARAGIGAAIRFLEQRQNYGFVPIINLQTDQWRVVSDARRISLATDRPARVLLLIHGTFSSTVGGFGALGVTPWGQAFLQSAWQNYDAVLGYDHPTLSVDPVANAEALLRDLKILFPPGSVAPHIDVVTHSRGGLVFRSLIELLLPEDKEGWEAKWGRAVLVAVVNEGTLLGEPENWHTFLDTYTNLAVQGCNLLALFPQAEVAAEILKELISCLSALVQALASEAVDEKVAPGLAAMRPDGPFLARLNDTSLVTSTLTRVEYCAVTSEFSLNAPNEQADPLTPSEQVLAMVAAQFTRRLMNQGNDLVVNMGSQQAANLLPTAAPAPFLKEANTYAFGPTRRVYHTIYFTRPEVIGALAGWLGVTQNGVPFPTRAIDDPIAPLPLETLATVARERAFAGAPSPAESTDLPTVSPPLSPVPPPESPDSDIWHNPRSGGQFPEDGKFSQSPQQQLPPTFAPTTGTLETRGGFEAPDTSFDGSSEETSSASFDPGIFESYEPISKRAGSTTSDPTYAPSREGGPEGASPPDWPDGAAASQPKSTDAAPAATTPCHLLAEMPDSVAVNAPTILLVSLSRDEVKTLLDTRTQARADIPVVPDAPLVLQIVCTQNLALMPGSAGQQTVLLPPMGEKLQISFFVQGTAPGQGAAQVLVLQNQIQIARLKLAPQVTDPAGPMAGGGLPSRSMVTAEANTGAIRPRTKPLFQMFVFEQNRGDEVSFQYLILSPSLKTIRLFSGDPLGTDRETYVNSIYKKIEEKWDYGHAGNEAFRRELQAIGAGLFEKLFPYELQEFLWDNRDAIAEIMVVSYEPFIPWEIVHLRPPRKQGVWNPPLDPNRTAYLGDKGLVRWLDGSWPPDTLQIRPDRAFTLTPTYPGKLNLPSAAKEAALVDAMFPRAQSVPTAVDTVQELLATPGVFDLLHFAGHGMANSADIMRASVALAVTPGQDGRDRWTTLEAETVEAGAIWNGEAGTQPIVVLNACQLGREGYALGHLGGFSNAFLKAGAGVFVGALWSVIDSTAEEFMRAFYQSLKDGKTLSEATRQARQAAEAAERSRSAQGYASGTHLAYAVYGHPQATLKTG